MPKQRIDRDDVIDAAMAVVDRGGLDDLVLARVAEELGVQSSALYNHVEGADALVAAVAARSSANLAERLRDAAVARSGDAALRSVGEAYRRFAREHPGHYASTMLPVHDAIDASSPSHAAIGEVVGRVIESFGCDPERAVHGARIVRSAIHGFLALEAAEAFTNPLNQDDSFDELLRFLVDGFSAGARFGEDAA